MLRSRADNAVSKTQRAKKINPKSVLVFKRKKKRRQVSNVSRFSGVVPFPHAASGPAPPLTDALAAAVVTLRLRHGQPGLSSPRAAEPRPGAKDRQRRSWFPPRVSLRLPESFSPLGSSPSPASLGRPRGRDQPGERPVGRRWTKRIRG